MFIKLYKEYHMLTCPTAKLCQSCFKTLTKRPELMASNLPLLKLYKHYTIFLLDTGLIIQIFPRFTFREDLREKLTTEGKVFISPYDDCDVIEGQVSIFTQD